MNKYIPVLSFCGVCIISVLIQLFISKPVGIAVFIIGLVATVVLHVYIHKGV